ncbi:hypothetical protein NE237_032961 [Protea cynaroides]|uniref:Uncharacterized protein n=1 Tax=Protea cynaroides TaxID=273540 RepID=A0A9Q0R3W3_9MAGN|nr:hypothetical protein NE237_032961 [Protea cynaroides]
MRYGVSESLLVRWKHLVYACLCGKVVINCIRREKWPTIFEFLEKQCEIRERRSPISQRHSVPLDQNMLQQRIFCKPVTPNTGYYGYSLLLDDVGDCISCSDETTNCSNPQ